MPQSAQDHIFSRFEKREIDVFEAILALDKASAIDGKERKDGGVVYTPRGIAEQMCLLADPALADKVFEPSCGRGVFLFALAEHHLKTLPAQAVHDGLADNLWACDLDALAVEDAKRLWAIYWAGKGVLQVRLPHFASEDSLFGAFSGLEFDLILGNPPYVRFQHLPLDYRAKIQASHPTCAKGNVDLYFAFVEQALRQSKRSCLIFPNSWMASSSGKALRSLLSSNCTHVADYGSKLPFAPVRAYVCVALAGHGPRPPGQPMKIQVDGLRARGAWLDFPASDPRIAPARWSLSAKKSPAATLGPKAQTLGDIAELRSGIATLADSKYSIADGKPAGANLEFIDAESGAARRVPIEFTPKKIKLTKAKSEKDLIGWTERILFPYDAKSELIPFDEFKEKTHDGAEFLLIRKDALALRDKGKQEDYPQWHAYGRKQGLKPLPKGHLVALPVMSEGSILCFEFDSAKVGPFLFTSGFALAPKPGRSCQEILNALRAPESWEWILAHGKPWAGPDGKNYRSYGARLLLTLPLPAKAAPEAAQAAPSNPH